MIQIPTEKKEALTKSIDSLFNDVDQIFYAILATEDGFPIHSHGHGISFEEDKFAAMNSTLTVLSNSCAKEVVDEEFLMTTVGTESGNILFVKTRCLDLPCVLMVASKNNAKTLALSRYKTNQVAKELSNI